MTATCSSIVIIASPATLCGCRIEVSRAPGTYGTVPGVPPAGRGASRHGEGTAHTSSLSLRASCAWCSCRSAATSGIAVDEVTEVRVVCTPSAGPSPTGPARKDSAPYHSAARTNMRTRREETTHGPTELKRAIFISGVISGFLKPRPVLAGRWSMRAMRPDDGRRDRLAEPLKKVATSRWFLKQDLKPPRG